MRVRCNLIAGRLPQTMSSEKLSGNPCPAAQFAFPPEELITSSRNLFGKSCTSISFKILNFEKITTFGRNGDLAAKKARRRSPFLPIALKTK